MAADNKAADKSRRERRKEARIEKNKKKFDSWIHHHQSRKLNKSSSIPKSTNDLYDGSDINSENKTEDLENIASNALTVTERKKKGLTEKSGKKLKKYLEMDTGDGNISAEDDLRLKKKLVKNQLDSSNNSNSDPSKIKKTKFEEYLEMDLKEEGVVSVEEDLALERKLAKKLKVKKGKLGGDDDELNMLFEGIPSLLDDAEENFESVRNKRKKKSSKQETSDAEEALDNVSVRKKRRKKSSEEDLTVEMEGDNAVGAEIDEEKKVSTEAPASKGRGKYVAPHLRLMGRNESEEHSQIRRRLRGLLNRLSESNVEAITGEVSTIFHSVARNVGSEIIGEEVLASFSGGPRGNEQYAAVFAAFVGGMACLVGSDFSAKLLASLAKSFEDEYQKEDNLSLRNLTLLLSYLYTFGVCSSDLIYDFMIMLSKRLTEVDVSIILTILQCCGMKLRSDDPAVMKNFIHSVQNRVTELKSSSDNNHEKTKSKRMEFMLETICDIKNNKKRPKEDTLQLTRIKKWLQKLAVENVLIRGLKWSKLLDPDKKGQWWLSGDIASSCTTENNIKDVTRKIVWEVPETQKMLQLAASQRMNTDARRAIFCIIMSGEDYIDTFEKLLRLDLHGKQDREIMRVLVECCLQEKVFNKYYCVLASKLCSHDKNHKFTLQYCLWDHFKEVESMQLLRSMYLSKFVAEMLASYSLSLAVLKVVDLNDTTQVSPKRIMHFRMLFEAIFEYSDKLVWNIFTRIAALPEYESLRNGIEFFISKYVVSGQKSFAQKLKLAKKALNNVEGIIL